MRYKATSSFWYTDDKGVEHLVREGGFLVKNVSDGKLEDLKRDGLVVEDAPEDTGKGDK